MKISIEKLQDLNACGDAVNWLGQQNTSDLHELYELAKAENHLDWCNWFLSRFLSRENRIRYAIFASESVLDIYESQYPNDAPRKAIEAAKKCLDNPTEENRTAAAAYAAAANAAAAARAARAAAAAYAAYAAYAAAYAAAANAAAAADAADAAAYAAAAAADAADAAAYAADDAVAAAAAAVARKEMMTKILDYGLELLETRND